MAERSEANLNIVVWDLPLRLFHWSLPLLLLLSWISAEAEVMAVHEWSGYTLLALLLFRLLWGLFGSSTARFSGFVRGPAAVRAYLQASRSGSGQPQLGHNPLGGWMVLALIGMLGLQVASGLFASDDEGFSGPLAGLLSYSLQEIMTELHEAGFNLLIGLVVLHVAAVLFYVFVRRDNILRPMLSGRRDVHFTPAHPPRLASNWLALLLFLLAWLPVYLLVSP